MLRIKLSLENPENTDKKRWIVIYRIISLSKTESKSIEGEEGKIENYYHQEALRYDLQITVK